MMRASGWLAEQHDAEQRQFVHLLGASFAAHALFVGLLAIAPTPDVSILHEVLRVDLVAGLPPAAAPSSSKPKPAPRVSPPPPAKPQPKQVVLPKQAPKAIPKARVAPPKPLARPEPIEYDDALSQLRKELGESTPAPVVPQDEAPAAAESAPAPAASTGGVDREVAAWLIETKRHVRSKYITPPEFSNRSLATGIEVVLTSGGALVGMPRVVRASGDPFFDDNAVRALRASAPLPAPPQAGTYRFRFTGD